MSRRITCSLLMLALMLIAMTVLATGFGALRLPVSLLWRDGDEALLQIWLTIRLPRVLLALVIGGRSLGRRVLLPYLVSILLILPLVLMT